MLSSDLASRPDDLLWPRYDGRSLVNLLASVSRHFGVDTGHAPLATRLPLAGAQTIVLIVADGLGHFPLKRHLRAGSLPHLETRISDGEATYATMTSTFPSSTMTAMTTIHTGASPAQHGWLGTSIHQGSTVIDLLRQQDLLGGETTHLPPAVGTVYRRLADAGVTVQAVTPAAFQGSVLNGWYYDGAQEVPYETLADFPDAIARAAAGGGPRYVIAYAPDFDTVSHDHGPYSRPAADTARALDTALHALLSRLPDDGSVLVLLTADHGHSDTPADLAVNLNAPLDGLLAGPPAGEVQARFLNVRPGAEDAVQDALADHATVIPAADAWADGLFGGPPAQETFRARTGTHLAVARHGRQLTWDYPASPAVSKTGMHGGPVAEQMAVPLVMIRP
ncbi:MULTISPECIES: alkaline phosphatase family protein [Deinococcus]|uniref:Alkaline phosphatase family protein n=1 Tax=Deinococcus rufus TaxID=2136097 RepID=A0ABV7Z314_9DEIO|nr:alkaline phosphatase family protein [Deinococcus sp. AB2017081]WQE96046.1 alkaline phosphatase family protein [Deinococcus sp. AB2017081]